MKGNNFLLQSDHREQRIHDLDGIIQCGTYSLFGHTVIYVISNVYLSGTKGAPPSLGAIWKFLEFRVSGLL